MSMKDLFDDVDVRNIVACFYYRNLLLSLIIMLPDFYLF